MNDLPDERESGAPDPAGTEPPDAELVVRTRAGDREAYGLLYARHVDAVRRAARRCARDRDTAEDLTGEVFTRVLEVLRAGGGPQEAVRAYLLTTLRRLAVDWSRSGRRIVPLDEHARDLTEPGTPWEPVARGMDRALVRRAYATLPERWQVVLWHTAVEGDPPARIAPLLGVSPNAVAALAVRARAGLRRAFLQAHVNSSATAAECRVHLERMGAFLDGALGARARRDMRRHLSGCGHCRDLRSELDDVGLCMRALVVPALLGGTAWAFLPTGTLAGAGLGTGVGSGLAGAAGAVGGAGAAGFGVTLGGVTSVGAVAGAGLALAGGAVYLAALMPPGPAAEPAAAASASPSGTRAHRPVVPTPGTGSGSGSSQRPAPAATASARPWGTPAPVSGSGFPAMPVGPAFTVPTPAPTSPSSSTRTGHPTGAPSSPTTTEPSPPEEERYWYRLEDLLWEDEENGWGPAELAASNGEADRWDGTGMRIAGVPYAHGVGVHAYSAIVVRLDGRCASFAAAVGVDDETQGRGTVRFAVYADGVPLADSGVLRGGDAARRLQADLTGRQSLELRVTDAEDGNGSDHADWADAALLCR